MRKHIAIIGGGLAGTACAYQLRKAGAKVTLYESGPTLAGGASGNVWGMYNPRLSAHRTPQSDFYAAAFALALRTFPQLKDIDWDPCGALHLIVDEQKAKRFPQTLKNWGWPKSQMRFLNKAEASSLAGIRLDHDALYLPQSGCVSPKKLCTAYTQGAEIKLNSPVKDLQDLKNIKADAVILANGYGALKFLPDLPLNQVRGQVTLLKSSNISQKLTKLLCYGGYCTPQKDGAHVIGATFDRGTGHSNILPEDDHKNLKNLIDQVPALNQNLDIIGHRASVRTTVKEHFPIIGRTPLSENTYICVGHGSHGILSSLIGAQLLTDMIMERPLSLPRTTIEALSPTRFTGCKKT